MTPRTTRALRLATNAGGAAALLGFFIAVVTPTDGGSRVLQVLAVPAFSFALFFSIVFPLAYAFPPTTDDLKLGQRFPGARKVVWPVMAVLTALVVWLVISRP
ncbi:MAG: hypothetical protein ABMA15_23035 [Vicinamibacterales bacterium]